MSAAIETSSLTKRYGETLAVDGLSLTVDEGEVYGLVGPNGAGKSTTIDIIMDYTRPTSGTAQVLGADAHADAIEVHRNVGILPDRFGLYDRLSGRRHVQYIIESKSVAEDPDRLLERVGLADAADQDAGGYSKGMQQRLALAMALVGDPSVLILDEPFNGLDPNGVRLVRQIVREEAASGNAVFFSSHVLGQVEALCDRIGLLSNGELIAEGTIGELREGADAAYQFFIRTKDDTAALSESVRQVEGVSSVIQEGDILRVSCLDSDLENTIRDRIKQSGGVVRECDGSRTSLEDVFVAYTGGERQEKVPA